MESSNWESDTKRRDGLYLHKLADEAWAIRYKGKDVTACPCCDKPLTRRAARLVADAVYPVEVEQ